MLTKRNFVDYTGHIVFYDCSYDEVGIWLGRSDKEC